MHRIHAATRVASGAAASRGALRSSVVRPACLATHSQGSCVHPKPGRAQSDVYCLHPPVASASAAWRQLPPSARASRAFSAGASEEAEKQPIEVTIQKVNKPEASQVGIPSLCPPRACAGVTCAVLQPCVLCVVRDSQRARVGVCCGEGA